MRLFALVMFAAGIASAQIPLVPLTKDFQAVQEQAVQQKKLMVVSLGREACGNCQKFYGYLKSGDVKLDTNKVIYVKMDIDNYDHQNYFFTFFNVYGNVLPFVGVMSGKGEIYGKTRTGFGTAEDYAAFFKAAFEEAAKSK